MTANARVLATPCVATRASGAGEDGEHGLDGAGDGRLAHPTEAEARER